MLRSSRNATSVGLAVALGLLPGRALGVDAFEIQVYDGTADARGGAGLELHVNRVLSGVRTAPPPEIPPNHLNHFTLEPSYGLFAWWELGGYLQSTLRPDGRFDYSGIKLRSKFVLPRASTNPLRLGVNLEFSRLPRAYDKERYGTEIRPIVAFEDERVLAAFNPILDVVYTGDDARYGPELEPCLMLKGKLFGTAWGIEYYAGLGPFAQPAPWREQTHYLFETFDLLSVSDFELNAGVGEGLNQNSNAFVAKVIVGYAWEPSTRAQADH
jgi:hypothetical protein